MADMAPPDGLTVVYSARARHVREVTLPFAPETVLQVIRRSGLLQEFPGLDLEHLSVSLWGRRATLEDVVRVGDRIELCRGLLVDPKVARRERFAAQGTRGTGLFARRRTGKQSGY